MNAKKSLIAIVVFALLSSVAMAKDTIKVGGNYDVTARTGANTAVALGNGAKANINNGGINTQRTSTTIGGNYKVNVNTGANTAVALGNGSSASINNGGIQNTQ